VCEREREREREQSCANVCRCVRACDPEKEDNERTLITLLFFSILFEKCGGIIATDETRKYAISTCVTAARAVSCVLCCCLCTKKRTYGTQRKAFSRRSWEYRAHFTVDVFARNSDDCIPD